MDTETLHAYDTGAVEYAEDWESQPAGTDLQQLVRTLYAAVDLTTVKDALSQCDLLIDEEVTSASSGRTIHRVVARKHQQR